MAISRSVKEEFIELLITSTPSAFKAALVKYTAPEIAILTSCGLDYPHQTALHICARENPALIPVLYKLGAKPLVGNLRGLTPFDVLLQTSDKYLTSTDSSAIPVQEQLLKMHHFFEAAISMIGHNSDIRILNPQKFNIFELAVTSNLDSEAKFNYTAKLLHVYPREFVTCALLTKLFKDCVAWMEKSSPQSLKYYNFALLALLLKERLRLGRQSFVKLPNTQLSNLISNASVSMRNNFLPMFLQYGVITNQDLCVEQNEWQLKKITAELNTVLSYLQYSKSKPNTSIQVYILEQIYQQHPGSKQHLREIFHLSDSDLLSHCPEYIFNSENISQVRAYVQEQNKTAMLFLLSIIFSKNSQQAISPFQSIPLDLLFLILEYNYPEKGQAEKFIGFTKFIYENYLDVKELIAHKEPIIVLQKLPVVDLKSASLGAAFKLFKAPVSNRIAMEPTNEARLPSPTLA